MNRVEEIRAAWNARMDAHMRDHVWHWSIGVADAWPEVDYLLGVAEAAAELCGVASEFSEMTPAKLSRAIDRLARAMEETDGSDA